MTSEPAFSFHISIQTHALWNECVISLCEHTKHGWDAHAIKAKLGLTSQKLGALNLYSALQLQWRWGIF